MDVALAIAGWTLAVAAALVAVVVAAPLSAGAAGHADRDGVAGRFALRWAGGLLGFEGASGDGLRARVLGVSFRVGAPDRAREPEAGKPRPLRRRGGSWTDADRFKALLRLARRVLRAVRVRARVAGVVGLADPADIAMLFLGLSALDGAVPGLDLDLRPDWVDEALDVDGSGRVTVWPPAVLWAAAAWWVTDRDGRLALRRGGAA
jgi:hypothetical protein